MGKQQWMGRQLYRHLNCLWKPTITSLDFIMAEGELTGPLRDAIVLAGEDMYLGISLTAAPLLYAYAETILRGVRSSYSGDVTKEEGTEHVSRIMDHASRAMLVVTGTSVLAWNARKNIVSKGYKQEVDELRFVNVIATLHPKREELWDHRNWLFQRLDDDNFIEACEGEIAACVQAAATYPKKIIMHGPTVCTFQSA